MPNGKTDWCKWLTLLGLIVAVALAAVVLHKVDKDCCSKSGYQGPVGVPPPPPGGSYGPPLKSSWSVGECKSCIGMSTPGDPSDPSDPADIFFYCDGNCIETNNTDGSCPPGAPYAYNASQCANPLAAGSGYLCGGPNFDGCSDHGQGISCSPQSGLPMGAQGVCHTDS